MKKFLLKNYLLLFLFCVIAIQAQSNFQLPKNTVFYMEVNGKLLNSKINWAKFNPVFQEVIKKENKANIWNDYSKTGVKYDQSQYHYLVFEDSIKTYTAHFILDDEKRFASFVNSAKKEGLEITKKNKYSYVSLDENTFIAWNEKQAVLKITTYTKPFKYDDTTIEMDSTIAVDSVAAVPSMPHVENPDEEGVEENMAEKPFDYKEEIKYLEDDLEYYEEGLKNSKETVAKIKKDIAYLKKHHKYPEEKPEIKSETEEETDEIKTPQQGHSDAKNEEMDAETDAEYDQRMDSIKLADFKIVKNISEKSFDEIFNSNFIIEVPKDKTQFKDEKADLFAYSNFGNIFKNRGGFGYGGSLQTMTNYLQNMYNSDSFYNLYFENDRVKMITNYKHNDPAMQKSIAAVYSGKANRKLAKLLSDQSIAYFSMNIDGYKSFDAMYDMVNKVVENEEYQKETSLMVETLKIALDEKAISKILPGNAIFILNDVSYKKVEYTDYDYDESYNEKEVKKTKDQAVPNFTFAFITENEAYWNRVFDMISNNKYASKTFRKKGNFYQLTDKNNTQVDQLLFGVKDGLVFMTTSADNLNEKSQSSATKKWAKDAAKYSLSGGLNTQKLVNGLEKEFEDKKDSDLYKLFLKNAGELTYKTDVKGDSIQSEMSYIIKNSSENSLMYFFDLFDDIYKIMEPEAPTKL